SGRDLSGPAQLGREVVPDAHLLQRGRQRRPLRRLGGAGAVQRRAPSGVQLTPLSAAREAPLRRGFSSPTAVRRQTGTSAPSPEAACSSMRATCRLRRSATITASAARVTTAPTPNAQWKPTTSASSGAPPAPFVLLVASVESTASPSAPPICCEVLNSP